MDGIRTYIIFTPMKRLFTPSPATIRTLIFLAVAAVFVSYIVLSPKFIQHS